MTYRNPLVERPPDYKRRKNQYEPRKRILIVCEGEETEPNYFRGFPIPREYIVVIHGIGENTISLVNEAIRLKKQRNYDQTWCVFDRDSFPANNFNLAIQVAQANRIQVAYSNEAFELWYILHYDYLNSGVTRQQYISRLTLLIGSEYRKNSHQMYDLLYDRQKDAIRNAKKLMTEYQILNPCIDNPSTTVHLLVEQLNRLFWEE